MILKTLLEENDTKFKFLNFLNSNQNILKFLLENLKTNEMKEFFLIYFELNHFNFYENLNLKYFKRNSLKESNNRIKEEEENKKRNSLTDEIKINEYIFILLNQLFKEDSTEYSMIILQEIFSNYLIFKTNFMILNILLLKENNSDILFFSLKIIELILSKCSSSSSSSSSASSTTIKTIIDKKENNFEIKINSKIDYQSYFIFYIFKNLKEFVFKFLKEEEEKEEKIILNLNSIKTTNLNIIKPIGLFKLNLIEFFFNLIRSIKFLNKISNNKFTFYLIESKFLEEITVKKERKKIFFKIEIEFKF